MKTFKYSFQHGFTLIELMIAMLLGVFLTIGIIQIFISSKQAYRLQENISRMQENGRFAMDYITRGVRMAGYTGCSSSPTSTNIIADPAKFPTGQLIINLTAISGLNNVANNWNSRACGTNECIAGTDVLNFMSSGSCGGKLTGNMSSDNANIQIVAPNDCGVDKDEIVIISDCSSSDVFGATSASSGSGKQTIAHAQNINIDNRLSKAYQGDAEIFAPKLMSYFIRSGAGGVPSLWSFDSTDANLANSTPQEIVEGIENMQVLYGVDTDVTQDYVPNYYVDASQVPATIAGGTGWNRVVSVRIELLAVSIENNLIDDPQPYTYNGVTFKSYKNTENGNKACPAPSGAVPCIYAHPKDTSQVCQSATGCVLVKDLRLRRVFSSTIVLRNRVP